MAQQLLEWRRRGGEAAAGGGGPEDDAEFQAQLKGAIQLIGSMLKLFSLEQIALTFNGGKDACVVFHLVRAAIADMLSSSSPSTQTVAVDDSHVAQALRRMKVLYFEPPSEFPEIKDFMSHVSDRYRIEYTVYRCSYKEGMADMVANHGIKAVVMGMRKGDPYTEESERLEPSSAGWPPFLRVYPILTWDYGYVWTFLRGYGLEYCTLYDRGYTSIGDYDNTVQNTALYCAETGTYLPAYELQDYSLERVNRKAAAGGAIRETVAQGPDCLHHIHVTVLCIGDLFLPSTNKDIRPITLARQLRELDCTVVAVNILPIDHQQVQHAISDYLKSCHGDGGSSGLLLVLTNDDRSNALAGEVIESAMSSSSSSTVDHSGACQGAVDYHEAVTAAPPSPPQPPSSAASSSTLSVKQTNGGKALVDWCPHINRYGESVLVLLPTFCCSSHLTLSDQKGILHDALTKMIAKEPSSSS